MSLQLKVIAALLAAIVLVFIQVSGCAAPAGSAAGKKIKKPEQIPLMPYQLRYATIGTDGVTEKLGVTTVLSEDENNKVTLTNTATAKQDWDGTPKELNFKTDVYSSTINSALQLSSDSEKTSFIASFGLSLCLSELQNKPYIISKDALLKFGITYSKPDISKDDNHVSIKTTLNVGDSKTDFNLGFQIDTASCVNSKMIITFSLKGL